MSIAMLMHFSICAQNSTDAQLAEQYFQNREYDKALDYYEKLYFKVSPQLYYRQYIHCLTATKNFNKAEKLIRKQIKQNPENLVFWVDLGSVYQQSGDLKKANNAWKQAVDGIKYDEQTLAVAKALLDIQQTDHAINAYLRGRKTSENGYTFSFELADIYKAKGDKLAMINEYLNVLETQEAFIQAVQSGLQTSFGNDADTVQNELLKTELLKRIQKNPDKTVFSELLIWMQLQQNDYEGAFIQAKALDKRKRESGSRIMNLAQMFTQNQNYAIAAKAYQYVIDLGPGNTYYTEAKTGMLNALYQKIILQNNYSNSELNELEKNYTTTINEFGKNAGTATLIQNLAHLQAFYLHTPDKAIALLNETITQGAIENHMQAKLKLELGDILLLSGDIWEASLRYSQVEKAFKYDEIGQEAKFRNAKISYYTHDFKWAQAQLDVLKGATAKLISNDAMELSLHISDALAIDSNEVPLQLFANACLLMFQNKDSLALITFDSVTTLYPTHVLADDILYKKAQIALKHHQYQDAAVFLESILKNFAFDVLADDALFKLAELNENKFKNKERAKALYQQLIEDYSGSLYVVEARKRFRILRGN